MYQGTSEKLKKKIQEFNANSEWFIFSQGDLEPNYKEISGKRYNIFPSELKQKLGEIISQRKTSGDDISSSPAVIEAQLSLDPNISKDSFGPANYNWWFSVRKEHIYQQARKNGGSLISLLPNDQRGNWIATTTKGLGYIFGDENYRRSSEWKEICRNEKKIVEEKWQNFRNTCRSARTEIKNKIEEVNMDLAEVFAGGEYFFDLHPQYCFCGDSPSEQENYYWDHITWCLDREERVSEFKNEVLKIIARNITRFNQLRKGVIEKAKQEAQNKGVQLDFDDWERAVYKCKNSSRLNDFEKLLNELIQTLANIGEEGRKAREQMAREEAKEKQKQAEKERKKQEKKEKNREEKTKQKERKKAENLQKEQESKEKEAEERFKSNENKDSSLPQEKKEIDNKIADLQKKLRDQEKLGDADNPSRQKEKEDLEK